MVQPLWKTVWRPPKKLIAGLPKDPAILLLNICPREMKTYIQTHKKLVAKYLIGGNNPNALQLMNEYTLWSIKYIRPLRSEALTQ